eukprot:16014017-Heterocapsa_arctica.AAC.1
MRSGLGTSRSETSQATIRMAPVPTANAKTVSPTFRPCGSRSAVSQGASCGRLRSKRSRMLLPG